MSDPLSITASIIAVLQLTATATQYLKDVKGGLEDRVRMRDEIRSTICLLEMLKDRAEDVEEGELSYWMGRLDVSGPLAQLKKALEKLVFKLAPAGRLRKATRGLTWPFDKKEVDELLSMIERQKTFFVLALQNEHM